MNAMIVAKGGTEIKWAATFARIVTGGVTEIKRRGPRLLVPVVARIVLLEGSTISTARRPCRRANHVARGGMQINQVVKSAIEENITIRKARRPSRRAKVVPRGGTEIKWRAPQLRVTVDVKTVPRAGTEIKWR